MNKEELIKRLNEVRKQIEELFENKNYKQIKNVQKEENKIIAELEKMDNLVWNYDYWITSIVGDTCDSLEEARQNLLEKLAKLNGVKVLNDKSGIKFIEVITTTKVYHYTIHAHYVSEPTGQKESVNLFGDKRMVDVYTTKCQSWLEQNIFNAYRNEFYF